MKQGIDKLYEKTPVSALGVLASGALLRADHSDLQDIYSAIGNRSAGAQLKFTTAAHHHTEMVLLWALDCQATCRELLLLTMTIGAADDATLQDEEGLADIRVSIIIKAAMQRKLTSLVAAMERICNMAGLEFEPLKIIAGIDAVAKLLMGNAPAIPEMVDEFVAQYGSYE